MGLGKSFLAQACPASCQRVFFYFTSNKKIVIHNLGKNISEAIFSKIFCKSSDGESSLIHLLFIHQGFRSH